MICNNNYRIRIRGHQAISFDTSFMEILKILEMLLIPYLLRRFDELQTKSDKTIVLFYSQMFADIHHIVDSRKISRRGCSKKQLLLLKSLEGKFF